MKILGITHPISLNSAACLLIDGKLVALAEEERFNRIKHSPHLGPNKSIFYCLKEGGITLSDIDYIAVGYDTFFNVVRSNLWEKLFTVINRSQTVNLFADKESSNVNFIDSLVNFSLDYYQGLHQLPFDYRDPRVKFIRHHIAHAASAYYVSGFDSACIISADGGGGQEAGILAVARGNNIRVLKAIPSAHSLGYLYTTITSLLGFEPHEGEGKVMGLSAYGDKKQVGLLPFVSFHDGLAYIDHRFMNTYLLDIRKKLKPNPLYKENSRLAARLQNTIEKAYLTMGEYLYQQTNIKNFCLSGGVSLNCVANSKLLNSGFVNNMFVQPASSDAGTALGAALEVQVKLTNQKTFFTMDHLYYGPQYSNSEIMKTIQKCEVRYYYKLTQTETIVAQLLADGRIIGWFQGRMEIGPRALGNRSILANPSIQKMKDIINHRVKGREPWRPFAPSLLEEYAPTYLSDVNKSPFMILESRVKPDKLCDIVAAIHVDGTVRPQTVSKKTNPRYWKLIDEFRKFTDIPVLLNTSFNLSGEPIVCTPQQAISTFFRCGMDYLVLGDFLISKVPWQENT